MAAVPPFLKKLAEMMESGSAAAPFISWSADGSAITIVRGQQLAAEVFPSLFKHSNYLSFVRQLHMYGFRKTFDDGNGRHEFSHPLFRRGTTDDDCLRELNARRKQTAEANRDPQVAHSWPVSGGPLPPPGVWHAGLIRVPSALSVQPGAETHGMAAAATWPQQPSTMHILHTPPSQGIHAPMYSGLVPPASASGVHTGDHHATSQHHQLGNWYQRGKS